MVRPQAIDGANPPAVSAHRVLGNGETKAEAASIVSLLHERLEQFFRCSLREPTALVLNVEHEVRIDRTGSHDDLTLTPSEFDRVVHEVTERGAQQAAVAFDDALPMRSQRRPTLCSRTRMGLHRLPRDALALRPLDDASADMGGFVSRT